MDPQFWLNCWEQQEISFHQKDGHPLLPSLYQTHFKLEKDGRVLVPLCGKSQDLHYFLKQDLQVFGVELSPIAIEDFFKAAGLMHEVSKVPNFSIYTFLKLNLYCGDIFNFDFNAPCSLIYDRAALIALPSKMRQLYAEKLIQCLEHNPRAKLLLITISYNSLSAGTLPDNGPPFSVSDEEVRTLFKACKDIQVLKKVSIKAISKRLLEQDVRTIEETSWGIGF